MDLNECFQKGTIKKTFIDRELIKSLLEMSDINESTVKTASLSEKNISSYVALAYDSLRGVLEALCILHGYKVLNHICIGELLVTLINDFDYDEFDRLRWIRNGINYYGKKVDFEQGKEIISKIFLMKKKIIGKHLKSF